MIAPLSRIAARYVSGALVTYGLMQPDQVALIQPDLALIVGSLIGALSEIAYALAVKKGWAK
jgi:hypothetical protein